MGHGTGWRDMAMPGGRIRAHGAWVAQAKPEWFDPAEPALRAEAVGAGGRQAAWFVQGPFDAGVLRHYRRGGLVAKLLKDQYVWTGAARTRSFAEFAILHWMREQGLPVPAVVAAAYWRSGPIYRAAIIVERLPGVTPLALNLSHEQAVAQAICDMHDAGVWHADLNAFNILLDEAGKAWLIDFDRARRTEMPLAERHANLQRLRRSLVKVAGQAGEDYWQRVNQIYHNF